jgi:hypothetical protein
VHRFKHTAYACAMILHDPNPWRLCVAPMMDWTEA